MKEEYTRETYSSIGKKYNNEKAIISLTSWKARINTVEKTLFSLIKQCPGFHIVLCLSEEEFPTKELELPEDLMLFVNLNLIEILWVYKNYKSFKKVLFTMDKYRDIPVVSADDDCIYTCNYAQILYDKWENNKNSPIIYSSGNTNYTQGPATIHPPKYFKKLLEFFKDFNDNFLIKISGDDDFLGISYKKLNVKILSLNYEKFPFYFHDEIEPINGSQKNTRWIKRQSYV